MSGFLNSDINTREESYREDIDFDDALRLPDGGSTCDIYKTKWHRRQVFVKRLKSQYRANPLYLDALDKEYEIGVNLKHPSLPDYREFHRDYIVMDYIDGVTLAELIKKKDPWLANEKNIVKLLRELVEVTDYLHCHNVTHCDIKPDNIMITANNRNLVLIDLDKCYTDSLDDTSGDPSKYGIPSDEKGKITIDFHGIGRVVEKIKDGVPGFSFSKYAEFLKACYKPDASTDDLLQILEYNKPKSFGKVYWMVTFAPFCVALLFGLVLLLIQHKDGNKDSYGIIGPTLQNNDSVKATATELQHLSEDSLKINKVNSENIPGKVSEDPGSLSQEQLHSRAKEMASQLDNRIRPYFNELNLSLDHLEELSKNEDITKESLLEEIRRHINLEDEYCQEAYEIIKETNPGISEREAWRVLAFSTVYTSYKRRATPLLSNL